MRVRFCIAASLLFVVATGTTGTEAHAGIAWGDATLKGDDVRVELDDKGWALVTHAIAIHVAAKRFRGFVLEGVDDHPSAPTDQATLAGMDGPGWPASLVDDKGEPIDAFIEPSKEARKLRVRLGSDGVPRGDYVLTVRYRADLTKTVVREGSLLRLTWGAPSFPEGYDTGHLTFVLPTATIEPKIALADLGGAEPRSIDGSAILEVRRTTFGDELTLTRPHVPHHDDARWVLTIDPKALPSVATKVPVREPSSPMIAPSGRRLDGMLPLLGGAGLLALLTVGLLRLRDRHVLQGDAERFRPILPLGDGARVVVTVGLELAATVALVSSHPYVGAALVAVAMATSLLRPVPTTLAKRGPGRWLVVPREHATSAESALDVAVPSILDPGGRAGLVLVFALVSALAIAVVMLVRLDVEIALGLVLLSTPLFALFATGRVAQLPRDRVRAVASLLHPIERALESHVENSRRKWLARTVRGAATAKIDEVRLRVEPTTLAKERGLLVLELGGAQESTALSYALVPELLVRLRQDSPAAQRFAAAALRECHATFATSLGRNTLELVIAVRPFHASPTAVASWCEWAMRPAEAAPDVAPSRRLRERVVLAADAAE